MAHRLVPRLTVLDIFEKIHKAQVLTTGALQLADFGLGIKMRLIDTRTLKLSHFLQGGPPCDYAILSHTWNDDEVSFLDMDQGKEKGRSGYSKLVGACSTAREDGFDYIWIDTCCIDKRSSAELSEAINSMFRYYKSSSKCYAYLEDIEVNFDAKKDCKKDITRSRWFTRGWTLQELLAPSELVFYSKSWRNIGNRNELAHEISESTSISLAVLTRGAEALDRQSVARKLSWAATRETTRPEDIAYCLLGLFDVQMPLLYGEGQTKAFIRLQEEIVKVSTDHSILAWHPPSDSTLPFRGAFADHPREFAKAMNVVPLPLCRGDHSVVERGLKIRLKMIPSASEAKTDWWGILSCHEEDNFTGLLGIPLQRITGQDEDFLIRNPRAGPRIIQNDIIERYEANLKRDQKHAVDMISIDQLGALRKAREQINEDEINALCQVLTGINGPLLLIRDTLAFVNPSSKVLRTIFIPKYPKIDTSDSECMQVIHQDYLTIDAVYPAKHWNPLSRTVQLRDMDAANQYGVILFNYSAYSKPGRPCTFAVCYNIDPTSTKATVAIVNSTETERIGVSPERLDGVVRVYLGMDGLDRVDVPLDPTRRDRVIATIKKVYVMRRSVWSLELHVSSLPSFLTSIRY